MLTLLDDTEAKKAAQSLLERGLRAALPHLGSKKISFRPRQLETSIYSAGEGRLWWATSLHTLDGRHGVPRYWNAFGIYSSNKPAQTIVVEINIPTGPNDSRVAGFFARASGTGETVLMHDGRIAGGRPGIGRRLLTKQPWVNLVEATAPNGRVREGIVIGILQSSDLLERIWRFVRKVHDAKETGRK